MVTRVACCSRATALAVAQSAARVRAAEAASSAPVSGASEAAAGQLSSRLGDSCVAAAAAESRTLHTPGGHMVTRARAEQSHLPPPSGGSWSRRWVRAGSRRSAPRLTR